MPIREAPLQKISGTLRPSLHPLIDGFLIASASIVSCLLILIASLMAPDSVLSNTPWLTDMGQNTALGLLILSCALLVSSEPAKKTLTMTLATISLLLAVMTLMQSALNTYPADGWMRVLVNTLPSDVNSWSGRMSNTTALIMIAYSLTLICLSREKSCYLALKAVLIGASLLVAFSAVASHILGSAVTSYFAYLSLPTATILTLHGAVLIQRLSAHPAFLYWETRHPGEAIFLRVLMPLSLLLTSATVAIHGYAAAGQQASALLAFAGLSSLVLIVVYRYIVGAVNNRLTAELQLAEREAALAQAQAQAKLGSWQLNTRENTLTCSTQCWRIFGLSPCSPLKLSDFMTFVHPDDRDYVQNRWQQGFGGSAFDIEYRILVAGSTRWVHDQATFVADSHGNIVTVLGTIQDITQLKAKELELLRSREKIRNLAARNEQIREQERRRLARELHDEMGQHLTALRLDTAMAQMRYGDSDADLKSTLTGLKEGIDTLIKITRDTAASLRPPALDFGLAAAIEWLLQEIQSRVGIQSFLSVDIGDTELDDALRTAAFRIIQESLTNVIKHANATEVHIHIFLQDHKLIMSITDNGRGFNPEEIREDKCFGLTGIRERIMMLGGEYLLDSQPGQGTRLLLGLPVRQQKLAKKQKHFSTGTENYDQNIYS